jgi:hypothetical protein
MLGVSSRKRCIGIVSGKAAAGRLRLVNYELKPHSSRYAQRALIWRSHHTADAPLGAPSTTAMTTVQLLSLEARKRAHPTVFRFTFYFN